MFDEPTPQNQPKVEDIFSATEKGGGLPPAPAGASRMPGTAPRPQGMPSAASPAAPPSGVLEKEGIRPQPFIIGGVIVLVLAALGFGAWFFFFQNTEPVEETLAPAAAPTIPTPSPRPAPPPPAVIPPPVAPPPAPPPPPPPPPTPVDTDNDGLSDEREAELGTDPERVDSDSDQLFDREEVEVYGTDPLNPDTDGDDFKDGEEVRNGYNPNGSGRLYQIPQ